jgi:hypothetical protein
MELVVASVQSAPSSAPLAPVEVAVAVPEAAFSTREIKTAVEPGVAVVELTYEFKNTGDFPLAVEEFIHSCGCMVGEWDGKPVDPGATGKIKAKFLTKGLRGRIRKSLRVKFLAMGTAELVAEVTIPEAITYSAQTLRWEVGAAPLVRQVDITVHTKTPLHVLSVSNNDPAFTSTLETLEEGKLYRVTLTPRDTDAERVCVLQVRTDAKDPRDALQGLFALVEKSVALTPSTPKGGSP